MESVIEGGALTLLLGKDAASPQPHFSDSMNKIFIFLVGAMLIAGATPALAIDTTLLSATQGQVWADLPNGANDVWIMYTGDGKGPYVMCVADQNCPDTFNQPLTKVIPDVGGQNTVWYMATNVANAHSCDGLPMNECWNGWDDRILFGVNQPLRRDEFLSALGSLILSFLLVGLEMLAGLLALGWMFRFGKRHITGRKI